VGVERLRVDLGDDERHVVVHVGQLARGNQVRVGVNLVLLERRLGDVELVAGNVYINRSCTGAVVGRHPFGGFKMSGGGTKAGGGDYLLQFLVPRVVTENIMRHGFAPDTTPEFRAPFGAFSERS